MEKANGIADEKSRQNALQKGGALFGTTANLAGFPIGLSEHFAVLLGDALPEQTPERSRQGSNL